MINNLKNMQTYFAGYIMKNTSKHYDILLRTIEERLQSKRGIGDQNQHRSMNKKRLDCL